MEEVCDEMVPSLFFRGNVGFMWGRRGLILQTGGVICCDRLEQPVVKCVCHLYLKIDKSFYSRYKDSKMAPRTKRKVKKLSRAFFICKYETATSA